MAVNFVSFNCNSFKTFEPYMDELLLKCDITCLQEFMITKQECVLLNSSHADCYSYGVSLLGASLGVITGRPYGGVGFIWKKHLDANVSIIECEYDWLCVIKISNSKKEYFLLNVYLPKECADNRDDYSDCLTKLNVVVENINGTCITIVGDLNANLSKQSMFGEILLSFCKDNNFDIVDKDILPVDTYTC